MKKITTLSAFLLIATLLMAYPINTAHLPKQAKTFLKIYWPNMKIISADRTGTTYSVEMDDGATISFNAKGLWQQLENEYGLPTDFIPEQIYLYVRKNYETSVVTRVKRITTGYEVKLDSGFTFYFGKQGNLLKID